jgi:hypothetical protein
MGNLCQTSLGGFSEPTADTTSEPHIRTAMTPALPSAGFWQPVKRADRSR